VIKLPEVAYYAQKIESMSKRDLQSEWRDAPINETEYSFLCDIQNRLSLKELADKYSLTVSGIAKWKQRLFIRLHKFDMRNLTR